MSISMNGILYPIVAFTIWGVLPLYWKALKQIGSGEILAHRIIWSCVFASLVVIASGGVKDLIQVFLNKKNLLAVTCAGILISANWLTYIWAINNDKVIEASLGLYINPIVIIIFGLVFLKERINFWQVVALALAFLGVGTLTVQYGKVPWVSLSLAVTFALYGLAKKTSQVSSSVGLALETLMISPVALIYLAIHQFGGNGLSVFTARAWLLLIMSGVVTTTPLYLFAQGAKVLPLSTIGFTQYISPSISLLLGIFLFKEPFTQVEFIAFGLIWTACAVYSLSMTSIYSRMHRGGY